MKYEFLKTVFEGDIEIAYLLDNELGTVVKIDVMDRTRTNSRVEKTKRRSMFEETEPKDFIPRRVQRKKVVYETDEYDDNFEQDMQEEINRKELPKVPVAMIPEHLRGVFLPQDTPGAAVERRTV